MLFLSELPNSAFLIKICSQPNNSKNLPAFFFWNNNRFESRFQVHKFQVAPFPPPVVWNGSWISWQDRILSLYTQHWDNRNFPERPWEFRNYSQASMTEDFYPLKHLSPRKLRAINPSFPVSPGIYSRKRTPGFVGSQGDSPRSGSAGQTRPRYPGMCLVCSRASGAREPQAPQSSPRPCSASAPPGVICLIIFNGKRLFPWLEPDLELGNSRGPADAREEFGK